jgi:hypothetical protein
MLDPRPPGLAIDGHPHLEGVLRREPVEAERREQANDAAGNPARGLGEIAPLAPGHPGKRVQTAADPLDAAALGEAAELGTGDTGPLQVARAGDTDPPEDALGAGGRRNCSRTAAS